MDCFRIEHVHYVPEKYKGADVSSSEIITSKKRSIVAMEYVEIYARNHDLDYHRMILSKDAAIEAVQQIGLNQISDVRREWFSSEGQWEMFNRRLDILRTARL